MIKIVKAHRFYAIFFIIISVGIASSLSLVGGIGIEIVSDKLLPIVPLVIILPALNSLVGDYATLIAAHAGNPAERNRTKTELVMAMLPSIGVNCIFIVAMGLLLASNRGYVMSWGFVGLFSLFAVVSILLVITAMFFLTQVLDRLLEAHKLNPDDVLIPIVTTISDVLMLTLIALAAVHVF